MENSQALRECAVNLGNEVEQISEDSVEIISPDVREPESGAKQDSSSEEDELEHPVQVTVDDFTEGVPQGFYTNIMPALSSTQTPASLLRPQNNIHIQWKGQDGGTQYATQSAGSEHQQADWVDEKGVVTITTPNIGSASWIPSTDGQVFPEGILREGAILKDGNVQYVLMGSGDQFYLVESGDSNAINTVDGSIKNIITGDKNIQMISIVPGQSIPNFNTGIGGPTSDPGLVPESEGREDPLMVHASSSLKRNNESETILSTIALEDCDLKHVEPVQKRKKMEKSLFDQISKDFTIGDDVSLRKGCELSSCPRRCTAVVDEQEREQINRAFYSLSSEDKKKFVMQCTRKSCVNDDEAFDGSSRTLSNLKFDFQLRTSKGTRVQVCKLFFANTLGFTEYDFNCYLSELYNSESSVYVCKSSNKRSNNCTSPRTNQCTCTGVTNSRHRGNATTGKWAASCKLHSDVYSHVHKDVFHRHIESFLRTLCIPQGENVRTIRYLPKDVSIQMMYEDFTEKHPDINSSYELYKNFVVLFTS